MTYDEQDDLQVRDKTIGLLRQALVPILKDKADSADMDKLAEGLYRELGSITKRLEQRIDANKPEPVDLNPIAELMVAITDLSKREINNQVTVEVPEIAELSGKVEAALEFMKVSQEKLIKSFTGELKKYTAPKAEPSKVAEVKIANIEDFKNIGQTQSIFSSKFPFQPSNGQGNTALKLVKSTSTGLDVMPIANADGTPISAGGGSGGDASAANQLLEIAALQTIEANQTNGTQITTISGVVSTSRTWTLDQATDSVKTYAQGITTVSGVNTLQVKDDYQVGEILADQSGVGGVLNFDFSNPVDFIWVTDIGATTTNISRVDPFGGTPSSSLGIPVFNATPTPINVTPARTRIQVYAPSGSTITMYGYRRQ